MDAGTHRTPRWIFLLAAVVSLSACETTHYRPRAPDGGALGTDADAYVAPVPDALSLPDGLPSSPGGPTITILAPTAGATVVGGLLEVQATVVDPDGVDPTTVTVNLAGGQPQVMTQDSKLPDRFVALLETSSISGAAYLWVEAVDVLGNRGSKLVKFTRDPGPVIGFLAPTPGGYYKGSLLLKVTVTDPQPITSFKVLVGMTELPLSKKALGSTKALYSSTVTFDKPFDPPLSGKQVLTATARNKNGAETVEQRIFYVDDEGPTITITSQKAGEVVGGTITLEATISDPAGVLPSSVKCVFGDGAAAKTIALKASLSAKDTYTGHFDTRTFDQTHLWPVMSFRASDVLGNESHHDIQVGLDNGPPIVELDPVSKIFMARYVLGQLQCSHPFDPVGDDAADDLNLVPQIVPLRARVEDQGNHALSAKFVPIASVDDSSVWMYVLGAPQKPLVVDSDGDGWCDSINPELVPVGSQPQQGKALAVNLGPIPVDGEGDFTPWTGGTFPAGCNQGTALAPPKPLCLVSTLTKAIFYSSAPSTPAIYAVPPAVKGDQVQCLGLPFDFAANGVANGWTCVAVEALDKAGNRGVSPPLRLWVDKTALAKSSSLPGSAGMPPSCIGTYDPATKTSNAKACLFRQPPQTFPQRFPPQSVLVEKASQGGV